MRKQPFFCLIIALAFSTSLLHAQGTVFTYQGRLNDGTQPASGNYDLRFKIYDAVSVGVQQGGALTNAATAVSNGIFTVTLDFGNQFPGADRWLEIGVRTNSGGAFTALLPRQPITPIPYAIYSATAATASNATTASANTANAIVKRDIAGNFSAGNITAVNVFGNGAGLMNLNATALANGTLPDGRLSPNVALLNGTNLFTGSNTYAGVIIATNANNVLNGSFRGDGAGLTNLNVDTSQVIVGGTNLVAPLTVPPKVPAAAIGLATTAGYPYSVAVAGHYAYVANVITNTLQIFDVSNPRAPVSVGVVATDYTPRSVAVAGRYAYVVNWGSHTLQIFDLGGAYIQQLEAGTIETGTLQTRDTVTVGNHLDVRGGLTVSGSARISGGLSVNNLVGGFTTNIVLSGHTFYITNGIIMNVQ